MNNSNPVFIAASEVLVRGELGTGSLRRRFFDAPKLKNCSYCACQVRHANVNDGVRCDQLQRTVIESKQIGLNCKEGLSHIYRYADDAELVPYREITQLESKND
jgi:hypothetical protein